MMACVFTAAPKFRPPAGMPPITPGSAVSVMRSTTCSSAATEATPSGMPMPRLTTALAFSSSAARRATTLRLPGAIGSPCPAGTRSSPAKAALYGSAKVWWWYSGFSASTTQSTSTPGTFTWRGDNDARSANRSTCAMTMPPLLCTAMAMASASSVSASRSIVRLPSVSAVVARISATSIGKAL